jgi:hypothetical protein
MENNTKTPKELMREFVSIYKARISANKFFKLQTLLDIVTELGLKCKDTNGLPFNGSTYELFREFDFNGHKLKETVGHFKYIYQIYGGGVIVCIYDDECIGGSALNGSESGKYIFRTDNLKRK